MKKLVILLSFFVAFAWAQSNSNIAVSGSGMVYGEPDIAVIELGVNIANADISLAMQEANDAIKNIMTMLNDAGVEDKDVRTAYFNIWFEEAYEANRKAQYRVNNAISVTIRDVNSVGAILAQSVEAGANSVNNIQYAIADTDALANQSRELAMQDARAKAEQLANLAGVELGSVLMINEGSSFPSTPSPMFNEDSSFRASGVPVSGGQLAVSTTIQVMFAIQGSE